MKKIKKIIVAGSRNFNDYNLLNKTLNEIIKKPCIIVSGCAKGADMLGERWAKEKGYLIESHPADWKNLNVPIVKVRYNKYGAYNAMAGHNRNKEMLKSIKQNPDGGFVVAFWDGKSKGTENMIEISKQADIDVYIVYI